MDRDEISGLIEDAVRWIEAQRETYRQGARPLTDSEKAELGRFFDAQTLGRARVKVVQTVELPDFSSGLPDRAQTDLLMTFSRLVGITFKDTIVISKTQMPLRSQLLPLLFHELVHVVQYEVLGIHAFMERYILGWVDNGFSYHSIPLERDAYELQEQYEVNPHLSFPISTEVRRRLGFY